MNSFVSVTDRQRVLLDLAATKTPAPASRNSLPYVPEVALAQRKYCGTALASGSPGEPFMETRVPVMFRRAMAIAIYTALAIPLASSTDNPPAQPKLSAAEIVERNVAARGGFEAWRAVQTLLYSGHLGQRVDQRAVRPTPRPFTGAGLPPRPRRVMPQTPVVPFLIEYARPRKQRIELQYRGQPAVQVFDGTAGWRLRPGGQEVEPFTQEELDATSTEAELDGFLIDSAAKGTKVELDGVEKVEDRDTYKLKLRLSSGKTLHVWIDSETFLETKVEGTPERFNGVDHPVEVYYRDYRTVDGLEIPFLQETRVLLPGRASEEFSNTMIPAQKMFIDRVVVNPKLDPSVFSKAGIVPASNAK